MSCYGIILYWSEADNAYIAEVPELPGFMVDGETRTEAVANAEAVIELWIEAASEMGRDNPAPRGRLVYA